MCLFYDLHVLGTVDTELLIWTECVDYQLLEKITEFVEWIACEVVVPLPPSVSLRNRQKVFSPLKVCCLTSRPAIIKELMYVSLSLSLRGGGELVDYFDTVCNSDLVEFLKQRAEEDGYVYIPTNIHHSGPTYTTVDQHTPQWTNIHHSATFFRVAKKSPIQSIMVQQHSCRKCTSYPWWYAL